MIIDDLNDLIENTKKVDEKLLKQTIFECICLSKKLEVIVILNEKTDSYLDELI